MALRKRILITGGAGFLGSHLSERLVAAGHDVLCVDNYFTGTKDNIAHLFGNPHFEVLRHDVTPQGLHYLLSHFDIPDVDAQAWRLALGGQNTPSA